MAVWAHWAYVVAAVLAPWAWPRLLPPDQLGLQVGDFVVAVTAGLVVAAVVLRRLVWRPGAVDLALAVYLGWFVVSWAANGADLARIPHVLAAGELCCLAWCTRVLASQSERELHRLVGVWVLAAALAGLAGVTAALFWLAGFPSVFVGPLGDVPIPWVRAAGPTGHPNLLGSLLLVAWTFICVAPDQLARSLSLRSRGLTAVAVVVGVGFVLSFSRSLVAGGLVGLWWILGRSGVRWRARLVVLALAAAAGLGGLCSLAVRQPVPHAFRGNGLSPDPAGQGIRYRILKQGLTTACKRPIFGHGPGSRPVRVRYWVGNRYVGFHADAHNTFLNVALKGGVVGLAAFLLVLWAAFASCATRRPDPGGLVAACALCLAALIFTGFHIDLEDVRHFWAIIGLCAASRPPDA